MTHSGAPVAGPGRGYSLCEYVPADPPVASGPLPPYDYGRRCRNLWPAKLPIEV
jgi:hypothetical protein